MAHPRNSGSAVRIYFKILDNEGDQQLDGNNINNYFKEIYIYLGQWHIFVLKMVNPHNSRLAVRTFLKFYTMKRANR